MKRRVSPEDIRLEIQSEFRLAGDELEDQVRKHHVKIKILDDEGDLEEVGRALLIEFPLDYAPGDEGHAFELDAIGQEEEGTDSALLSFVEETMDIIEGFVLFKSIIMEPAFRGRGIGRAVIQALVDLYANRFNAGTHMILLAHAIETEAEHVNGKRLEDRDLTKHRERTKQLIALYESEGFRRLGDTGYLIRGLRHNDA